MEWKLSENEIVRIVDFGSKEYDEEVHLRYEILRKPLNLHFKPEQLAAEKNNIHFGLFQNKVLIACLILVPENDKIKMKQVAVAAEWQGKGMGSKLLLAAESYARNENYTLMYCHARDTAAPFYLKHGYRIVGDKFEEVSIPHYRMEKEL